MQKVQGSLIVLIHYILAQYFFLPILRHIDHDGDTSVQIKDKTRDVNVTSLNKSILLISIFIPIL